MLLCRCNSCGVPVQKITSSANRRFFIEILLSSRPCSPSLTFQICSPMLPWTAWERWRPLSYFCLDPDFPRRLALVGSACNVLRAISSTPSYVWLPPMKPPACTKIQPGMPVSLLSSSSNKPRHAFTRYSLQQCKKCEKNNVLYLSINLSEPLVVRPSRRCP